MDVYCEVTVIIPPTLRAEILSEVHEGHPGISRMKSLACMFVCWLGLTKIER